MLSIQNFIFAVIVLVVACVMSLVAAANGGDVSQAFSVDAWKCAKDTLGFSFGIARGYHSYGTLDTTGKVNVNNAHAAGIKYFDLYLFPCTKQSAKEQVTTFYNYFKDEIHAGSMVWFDIETDPYQSSPTCGFLGELIVEARALGIRTGVYSSPYEWGQTVGDACRIGVEHGQQLWIADYNGRPGFEGLPMFGGWSKPAIHQWADNGNGCGMSYDKNYYP